MTNIACRDVSRSYVEWCGENGCRSLNSGNFGKEVKRTLPKVTKKRRQHGKYRMGIYCGMAMKEEADVCLSSSANH